MLRIVCKPHRPALLANTADTQKLFAMLQLIPTEEVAQARPPVALALVMDTSSSMREFADQERAKEEIARRGLRGYTQRGGDGTGQSFDLPLPTKLEQAIEAAHALIEDERLAPQDQVTIIHFDDDAHTLLPLTPLAERGAAHQAVDSLARYSGGTHMARGMRRAWEQLSPLPPQTVKRVLLLTDGQTFDEPECRSLAAELGASNTPIIALGVGVEYNADLLREVSDATQGRAYPLGSTADLRAILDAEVGSSVREVVTDLQATVATVRGVTLDSLTRVYPSLSAVGLTAPHRLGNIAAGDYTVFILEFTVAGIARPPSRARIAQIGLAGFAPGLGRRSEFPVQDVFVTFTTDQTATAAVDAEVMGYVQQKNVDRMLQEAARQATQNVDQARHTLQVAVGMTQRLGNRAMTQILQNALNELSQTGTISDGTRKTIALGGRTRTVRTDAGASQGSGLSDEEIRRLTGA